MYYEVRVKNPETGDIETVIKKWQRMAPAKKAARECARLDRTQSTVFRMGDRFGETPVAFFDCGADVTIRSLREVAGYLGVEGDDIETVRRAMYKQTACGGSLSLITKTITKKVEEVWIVQIHDSLVGPVVTSARRKGGKPVDVMAPEFKHLREFLCIQEGSARPVMQDVKIKDIHVCSTVRRVTDIPPCKGYAVRVECLVERELAIGARAGIVLHSIVEGSDAEYAGRELLFPFSVGDLRREIEEMESFCDTEARFVANFGEEVTQ